MNRQQLTLLLVLGVVIGGLGLYMARRGAASYQTTTQLLGQQVLPDFPMNDVTHITIRDATNELNLVRRDNRWRVRERHDYPADFQAIGGLLRKFWEMKIVQADEVGPSLLPRLQLADPDQPNGSGTLLTFQGAEGREIASVLLGRQHMRQSAEPSPMGGDTWPDGRYLRVLDGSPRVLVVSDALSEVEPRPDRFLNKDFFRIEKVKALEVRPPDGPSWRLARETEGGTWTLADAGADETLDTTKVTFANNVLAYPSFVDVVDPQLPPEETGMDNPWTAIVETFEGLHYTVRVGDQNADEQYHLAVDVQAGYPRQREPGDEENDEDRERLDQEFREKLSRLDEKIEKERGYADWTYLVSKWTVDSLLKQREDLLKDDAPAEEPEFSFDDDDFDELSPIPGLDLESLGIFPER
jgi:hypothetical protein